MMKNKIDRVIFLMREELALGSPTMSLSSGKIAGTSEAGDEPPVNIRKRKKNKYLYLGKNSRKLWKQSIKGT